MVSCNTSSLLALVLLVSTAANAALSQNAAARAFSAERRSVGHEQIPRNHYARAITLDHGKRFRQHRRRPATQEQLDEAARAKAQDDQFHADNAAWQQAAIKALGEGKTPQTFDEFVASHSSSSTKSAAKTTDNDDANDSPSNNDSDSKAAAQPKKVKATPPAKQAVKKPKASSSTKASADNSQSKSDSSSSSASSSGKGGLLSDLFSGDATFYNTGLGSCGWTNADSDYIVAISHGLMDSMGNPSDPNHNPACGKKIRATIGSKSVDVTVVDRCGGCAWGDLDFSPSAFEQISSFDVGRDGGLKWSWIN